jgi:monoamine oxidase
MGLNIVRILRGGFGYVRPDASGRPRLLKRSSARGWEHMIGALAAQIRPYSLAEQRWDSPIAADLARRSVAQWLDEVNADPEVRTTASALRGFFLADPEELSLLALVDQFASGDSLSGQKSYRIEGGNDRIASALAATLGSRLKLTTEVVAVSHRGKEVRVTLKGGRSVSQTSVDYLLFAVPATLLRRIPITPALPVVQHEAIAKLKYGRGTKTLLQFSKRFWRVPGRPRAFGSALPFGAVWDGAEEQRGRPGILSLLAGGTASDATRDLSTREGIPGLATHLDWLGSGNAEVIASHQSIWESDVWARGGYAFFDPSYEPAFRPWLARPCGRLFFAGEHTSIKWQGYMNGAIESGRRAAAEIEATHRLSES